MVNIFYLSGNVLDARVAAQGNKTQSLLPAQQPGRELGETNTFNLLHPFISWQALSLADPIPMWRQVLLTEFTKFSLPGSEQVEKIGGQTRYPVFLLLTQQRPVFF